MGTKQTETTHIILLVHGIRDEGAWQDEVARVLKKIPGFEVFPIGFGYLNIFAFIFPFIWRQRAINEVEQKFNAAVAECPGANISFIAHSFGTYAVVKMLERRTDIRLHRLILCGSIVSRLFRWGLLRPRMEQRVINDYGYNDVWPVMAASVSFSFGPTGTFGCRTPEVLDRPHDFGHGGFFGRSPDGFFDPTFAEDYWLPLFETGEVEDGDRLPKFPWLLSVLPLVKWVVLVVVITIAIRFVPTYVIAALNSIVHQIRLSPQTTKTTEVQLSRDSHKTYFCLFAGDEDAYTAQGDKKKWGKAIFLVDFLILHPDAETIHEARLFLKSNTSKYSPHPLDVIDKKTSVGHIKDASGESDIKINAGTILGLIPDEEFKYRVVESVPYNPNFSTVESVSPTNPDKSRFRRQPRWTLAC